MNNDTLTGAAALGAVAGLRSMMAPALLSQAARTGSIALEGTQFEFLSTQRAADIATGAAVLELVGDKLPFTPDRTSPLPLIARAASGAMVGAALCAARNKDLLPGALVGRCRRRSHRVRGLLASPHANPKHGRTGPSGRARRRCRSFRRRHRRATARSSLTVQPTPQELFSAAVQIDCFPALRLTIHSFNTGSRGP